MLNKDIYVILKSRPVYINTAVFNEYFGYSAHFIGSKFTLQRKNIGKCGIFYFFNTTGFLNKFMNDNSWTFDGIVDFESKSQVLYHYGGDGELKSTEYLVSELSQKDVDMFILHLEWILMEETI